LIREDGKMRKGFSRNYDPIKILTNSQVEAIHRGTLDVLEKKGVQFESEKALKILEKNGCTVDYESKIAKIPEFLVEECIRKSPSSFSVKARDPKDDLRVGGNVLYFMPGAGSRHFDIDADEVRVPTFKENNDAVLIADALETVDFFPSYTPYFEIEEVEPVMLCPTSLASRIRYTSRVSRGAQATETYIWETQLAQAVGQQLLGVMDASPPLTWSEDALNAGFEYTNAGFPIMVASGGVMGGTAPVTIAGATISNNVECLSAIVFLQCVRPGTGILVNDFILPMNMQNGSIAFGSMAQSLQVMAFNQIWKGLYDIPTFISNSGYPSSKRIDYQCAYEKMHISLVSALSGANGILFHGSVSSELSYNPILSIIEDDVANIIGRIIEGFEVNNETMAVELIEEVGSIPGTFLNKKHTRDNWKKDLFIPQVADRVPYQEWARTGKKSVIERAKERMEEILKSHKPSPITPEQDKDIDRILSEARKYYKKKELL
jgi:trimethylamine--corrinoid protein Co-methyltransferase